MIQGRKLIINPASSRILIATLYVIYISDSLIFAASGNYTFWGLAQRLTPLLIFFCIAIFHKISIKWPELLVCISIIVSMLLNGSFSSYSFYISQVVWILFGIAFSKTIDKDSFINNYIKVLRIIAIVSLVGYVFRQIIIGIGIIPTIHNVNGKAFKFLFFTNIPINNISGRRNWGPFWEPGAYQYYLNIALLFTLMKKNIGWKRDSILFLITLLTTLSGASILPVPFILLAYLFKENEAKENNYTKIVITVILSVAIILLIESGYFDEIFNKLSFADGTVHKSAGYRLGTIFANLRIAITHPLFGASPAIQEAERRQYIGLLNGINYSGNVNTITGYFSYFGILVGSYIVLKIYNFTRLLSSNRISRIFCFVAIIIMTSNENFMQSLLLGVLFFMGYYDAIE